MIYDLLLIHKSISLINLILLSVWALALRVSTILRSSEFLSEKKILSQNFRAQNVFGQKKFRVRVGKSSHFVAPSRKLEVAGFSAQLRIQDGAECGNVRWLKAMLNDSQPEVQNIVLFFLVLFEIILNILLN